MTFLAQAREIEDEARKSGTEIHKVK